MWTTAHTANERFDSPQNPIGKKKSVYYKVIFSVFLLYKVSDAGGRLVESFLQG